MNSLLKMHFGSIVQLFQSSFNDKESITRSKKTSKKKNSKNKMQNWIV